MKHYKLNSENFNVSEHIPEKPGVYAIIALDENDKPLELNRIFDFDMSGTLYIGKSENLRKRITNMRRAFLPNFKSTKHIGVRRYQSIKKFAEKFPIDNLAITIELARENETAFDLEKRKFRVYEKFFGERPPLNRQ